MPFCPNCKSEYLPGIETCPDCQQRLVGELPDATAEQDKMDGSIEWKPLAVLTSSSYAEMVVEGLRSEGIRAVVLSSTGYFGTMGMMGDGTFRSVGGGYTVLVDSTQADDADEIAEALLGEIWVKSRISQS